MDDLLGGRQVHRHASIREQVADIIRDAIVNVRLEPGQVLVERQLCDMTGASRTSVREALRQLEAESLVISVNGRGTIVAVPDLALARGVYEASVELEGVAAEVFVTRASVGDRAALRDALGDVREAIETHAEPVELYSRINAFFEVLLGGTRNEVLAQTLRGLHNRVGALHIRGLGVPGRAERTLADLDTIVRSITANDPAASRRAAASFAQQVASTTFSLLSPDGDEAH